MKVILGKYPGPKSKKERKVEVRIDPWDIWNADNSLAMIIHPLLIKLKEDKQGYPGDFSDGDEDGFGKGELGGGWEAWSAVLDTMIWSFHEIIEDDYLVRFHETGDANWCDQVTIHEEKIQEGLDAFGKFFRALWT